MLRILLFVGTNLAIMLVLSIVVSLFGLDRWAYSHAGINLQGMLILCAVFGMGGSFISLAMSKTLAKMSVGAQVIAATAQRRARNGCSTPSPRTRATPTSACPTSPSTTRRNLNAFATGMSKNHALVAVSTGLLQSMDRDQVNAVLGHEITHVANGDMVTLALIQGVLNTFVMFLARIIGGVIDGAMSGNRDDNRGGGIGYFFIVMILQTVLGVLATIIVMWFSRWREFRADAGGAKLGGRENMISALQALGRAESVDLAEGVSGIRHQR